MEEQKPRSIRTIGIIVAIVSGFIIFFNSMGALVFSLTGLNDGITSTSNQGQIGINQMEFIFKYYSSMCLIIVTMGITYLIGAIYLIKFRLWANKLVSIISILFILGIWGLMICISFMASRQISSNLFYVFGFFNALFWSTPFGLLIWYLNQEKIKKHFA